MKKLLVAIVALTCLSLFVPAVFAGDTAGVFKPTLRIGCAFDAAPMDIEFNTSGQLLNINRWRPELPSAARLYIATDLPFAVTDRLTLSLGGDWSFSATGRRLDESESGAFGIGSKQWNAEGALHWVSADLLASYALVKDSPMVIKDLSVVAGVRWDYQIMSFTNPVVGGNLLSAPDNEVGFWMHTVTPVAGLSCTVAVPKTGPWFGDIHLDVLAGPVVWGREHFAENYTQAGVSLNSIHFDNDVSHGYIVRAYADLTLLSGKIGPADGTLSLFGQYTKTNVKGDVHGRSFLGATPFQTSPAEFEYNSDVVVFGLVGSLAFDLYGRPAPVTPPPAAPAPPIEPKLEPMSQK